MKNRDASDSFNQESEKWRSRKVSISPRVPDSRFIFSFINRIFPKPIELKLLSSLTLKENHGIRKVDREELWKECKPKRGFSRNHVVGTLLWMETISLTKLSRAYVSMPFSFYSSVWMVGLGHFFAKPIQPKVNSQRLFLFNPRLGYNLQ